MSGVILILYYSATPTLSTKMKESSGMQEESIKG